jgi:nitroreductase
MKKCVLVVLILGAAFGGSMVFAQQNAGSAGTILNHYAAKKFMAGAIPKVDLDRIVQAGIRAPSALNRQPWHFTVVQNQALAKKIMPQVVDGNVLIVISTEGDGKTNSAIILDCGLATESIYLAAQALGYGSRIYTGSNDDINRNFKSDLGLPGGHSVVSLVRVGKVMPGIDAVSGASGRKPAADMVTYK